MTRAFSPAGFALVAALAALLVGCGGGDDLPMVECEDPIPTYSEVALFDTCVQCHASDLEGTDRTGAPSAINFDTYEAAMTSAMAAVEAVESGVMPPGQDEPAEADKQDLYRWGLCGTPQ